MNALKSILVEVMLSALIYPETILACARLDILGTRIENALVKL